MGRQTFISLQTKIILLVWIVVAIALAVTGVLVTKSITGSVESRIGQHALDVARIVAKTPGVVRTLEYSQDEGSIQEIANRIREATNVEFVVVFDMDGVRKSHPNVTRVGGRIVGGDEELALKGQEYVSTAQGTLGNSLRAFTPVFTDDGRQVGAVVVGILLNDVQKTVGQNISVIYLASALGLTIGLIGAIILARNVKKTLFGLEPFAIARLLEERNAMLQSVREGVLAVDKAGILRIANAEAMRILNSAGIHEDLVGKHVNTCVPNTRLTDVLQTGKGEFDQEQNMNGVVILTNRVPVIVNNQIVGAIATFRDMTEVKQLAEELTGVRSYVEALRSQAHEFMNKLHVILGMVRLGYYDQLAEYINHIANEHQAQVNFVGRCIKDHVVAGFLIGKFSRARELNADMELTEDSYLPQPQDSEIIHDLVCILGNLIDNALEAVNKSEIKRIVVSLKYEQNWLDVQVSDSGPGINAALQEKIFTRGFSTKGPNRGIGLALVYRTIERLSGTIKLNSVQNQGTRFIVRIPYKVGDE